MLKRAVCPCWEASSRAGFVPIWWIALEDGPSNDGLIQRFQLLVWPDTTPNWNYVDRVPDAVSEAQAALVFRKLVELDAENPARFRFASDAQELFIDWLAALETKIRGDELHPASDLALEQVPQSHA